MGTTFIIAKREFRSNFDSPLAYVVICLGLILLGFVFFFWGGGFWQEDQASLARIFRYSPWGLSLLVVPVVTMRLLAEERRSGTLEMLITLPVRDHEVILGKFLGAWGLVLLLILSTAIYPLMMFKWPFHLGSPDTGPITSGYLALILYSAAAVSIGLLISALTESQTIAFLVTVAILFFLHGIGVASESAPWPWLRTVIGFISFETRIEPFSKGLINTRDIVYFVSITVGCLMAAFRALERRKWA
jgi:ABC-2 type transport system permease protein